MTTIQLTLSPDDIHALELVIFLETINEPMLVALSKHILEQVKLKEECLNNV
jgi:hypothetical protein